MIEGEAYTEATEAQVANARTPARVRAQRPQVCSRVRVRCA